MNTHCPRLRSHILSDRCKTIIKLLMLQRTGLNTCGNLRNLLRRKWTSRSTFHFLYPHRSWRLWRVLVFSSNGATLRYKCSKGSTLWHSWPQPLKIETFSTSIVKDVYFGSSGTTVTTFQYKCSARSPLRQHRLESRNFAVHAS